MSGPGGGGFGFPGDEGGLIDVERRTKNAEYVLGDPTVFPVDFLNWLKRYIEQSGITFPLSSIIGGGGSDGGGSLPAGSIFPFGGPAAPAGTLACDGSSYLRSAYPFLFAAIQTAWGAADGDHFSVPDLRKRTLFGAGSGLAVGQTDSQGEGARGGPTHHHGVHGHGTHDHGTHTHGPHSHGLGREVVSLRYDAVLQDYSILGNMSTHDISTDNADVPAAAVPAAAVPDAQVGPAGTLQDAVNWAGVLYVISTGV